MRKATLTRMAAAAVLVLVTAAGCSERDVIAPKVEPPEPPPEKADTLLPPSFYQPIACTVTVTTGGVNCAAPEGGVGIGGEVVIGGQGQFINLETSNAFYNKTTEQFTMNVVVRNLIGQKLGTEDGVSTSAFGVRVFFATGPMLLSGSGPVQLVGADGIGNFTGVSQPYYRYNQVLDPYQASSAKQWTFSLPPTVTSYTFTAYVATMVQYPKGWIDVTPSPFPLQPGSQWTMAAVVRNVVGEAVYDAPVTWTIADTTRATLQPDGTVTAVRAGNVNVTATSGSRTGTGTLAVMGITRQWSGAVSTDWFNKLNWVNDVLPEPVDSVFIPAAPVNQPALTANVSSVGGVTVENGAVLSLGAFNLTTTQNVATGITGGITSSSGTLFLAGTAKTVVGILPLLRVTGTYSLAGNITISRRLQVDLGRLTNTAFRIQTNPF